MNSVWIGEELVKIDTEIETTNKKHGRDQAAWSKG